MIKFLFYWSRNDVHCLILVWIPKEAYMMPSIPSCKTYAGTIIFGCHNSMAAIRNMEEILYNVNLSLLPLDAHDDVIKWKHFPRYWPFVRGIQSYDLLAVVRRIHRWVLRIV